MHMLQADAHGLDPRRVVKQKTCIHRLKARRDRVLLYIKTTTPAVQEQLCKREGVIQHTMTITDNQDEGGT